MTSAVTQRIINRLRPLPDDREPVIMNFIAHIETEDQRTQRGTLDLDAFCVPTERGKRVNEYMEEMRANDRI